MEINIENCRAILEKTKKLSSDKFDKKLTCSKSKGRKFTYTEVDVIFKAFVKKYQKLFGESYKNEKKLFFRNFFRVDLGVLDASDDVYRTQKP